MPLILETGSGVRTANSYVTVAFVTSYLTNRNRQTENTWSTRTTAEQEAACVAATDYIDSRWGTRFKGLKQFGFNGSNAQAVIDFTGNPANAETLTVGEFTYTFVTALVEFNVNEILIGATIADTITNLLNAIKTDPDTRGVTYSNAELINTSVSAALRENTTSEVIFTAVQLGESGNDTPLAEVSAGISILSVFKNGTEFGSQPLEFPRFNISDKAGRTIVGIPTGLKQASSEYAVRAVAELLYRDPIVDDTGRDVVEKRERVGPIEEQTRYAEGSGLTALLKPYPAADRLLLEYVVPGGGVFR